MDEDYGWKYQIYGDGTLEVGLLFGFEFQLFGVGDNVKDMFNIVEYLRYIWGTMLQNNSSWMYSCTRILSKRSFNLIKTLSYCLCSCFKQVVKFVWWVSGIRCAFVPIFEGRHYHLGPICIKSEEFFSLLLDMLRQKLLHLLKIQIAPGWRDGRMLTIFKSVTSTTFQLSNFYNEQWDTTELMNLGQSRGIITWALWKELSTTQ